MSDHQTPAEARSADDAAVIAAVSARIDSPQHQRKGRALAAAFSVFVLFAFAGALAALVFVANQGAQQREELIAQTEQNEAIAQRVADIATSIRDCTIPKGKCAQEAAAQTAAQTGAINATVIAVGVCLNTPGPTLPPDVFRECVVRIVQAGVG